MPITAEVNSSCTIYLLVNRLFVITKLWYLYFLCNTHCNSSDFFFEWFVDWHIERSRYQTRLPGIIISLSHLVLHFFLFLVFYAYMSSITIISFFLSLKWNCLLQTSITIFLKISALFQAFYVNKKILVCFQFKDVSSSFETLSLFLPLKINIRGYLVPSAIIYSIAVTWTLSWPWVLILLLWADFNNFIISCQI